MEIYHAEVRELRLESDGQRRAFIVCPSSARPRPGQYLQAHAATQPNAPLPFTLFPAALPNDGDGFLAAPTIPTDWQPGTQLTLRGPLGNGFNLPNTVQRLALIALGSSLARLLPLAEQIIPQGGAVAIFSDAPLPQLPPSVEANPLAALGGALDWADFLALDGKPEELAKLAQRLGFSPQRPPTSPAQALVEIEMPCGGLAECGVCAVPTHKRKTLLPCADGPVIEWRQIITS